MPGQPVIPGQVSQDITDHPGAPRKTGQLGYLSIGGHPARGDAGNQFQNTPLKLRGFILINHVSKGNPHCRKSVSDRDIEHFNNKLIKIQPPFPTLPGPSVLSGRLTTQLYSGKRIKTNRTPLSDPHIEGILDPRTQFYLQHGAHRNQKGHR